MAEEEKKVEEETSSHGNDWEVVSLTASAYAAAPGPKRVDVTEEGKDKEFNNDKKESSQPLFMSGHFIFAPGENENLLPKSDYSEIQSEPGVQCLASNKEEVDGSIKTLEDNFNIKGFCEEDELAGIQFFDKGKKLCVSGIKFDEGKAFQGLNLIEEDHVIYADPRFSCFQLKADTSPAVSCEDDTNNVKHGDPSRENLDTQSKTVKLIEGKQYDSSGLPSEAWWKRQAASFYAQAKEASSFWSIFVAAAIMGLVILGQKWQQERWQKQQLKWHFSVNDEKINQMGGPISRFKEVLVGSHRRTPVIRGSSLADR